MTELEEKRRKEIIEERLNNSVPIESLYRGSLAEIKRLNVKIGELESLKDENEFLLQENERLKKELEEFKNFSKDREILRLEEVINELKSKDEMRKLEIQKKDSSIIKRKEETISLQKKISKLYVKISSLSAINILHESNIRSREFKIGQLEEDIKTLTKKLCLIKEILEIIQRVDDEEEKLEIFEKLNKVLQDVEESNKSS